MNDTLLYNVTSSPTTNDRNSTVVPIYQTWNGVGSEPFLPQFVTVPLGLLIALPIGAMMYAVATFVGAINPKGGEFNVRMLIVHLNTLALAMVYVPETLWCSGFYYVAAPFFAPNAYRSPFGIPWMLCRSLSVLLILCLVPLVSARQTSAALWVNVGLSTIHFATVKPRISTKDSAGVTKRFPSHWLFATFALDFVLTIVCAATFEAKIPYASWITLTITDAMKSISLMMFYARATNSVVDFYERKDEGIDVPVNAASLTGTYSIPWSNNNKIVNDDDDDVCSLPPPHKIGLV